MKESYIQTKVVSWARNVMGVQCCKLATMAYRAYPDFIFFIPGGKPLMIEFKSSQGTPTANQKFIHDLLRKSGYVVNVENDILSAKLSICLACMASSEESEIYRKELGKILKAKGLPPVGAE